MIAVGYARRSKKSDEQTISITQQIDHIRQAADRLGFDFRGVFEQDGVSGRKRARFAQIDQFCAENGASWLIVYQLDRLARDLPGLMDYLAGLNKRGIRVLEASTGQEVKTEAPGDWLSVSAQGLFAEFFPRVISVKTKDALALKRKQGSRYSNIPPLGYYYQGGQLKEEPEEQRALTTLAKCRAEGLGARRALAVLQAIGYTGRQSLTVIHKALRRVSA